jgi:aminopeptidase-like protein
MLWVLNQSDGSHSLLDIAEQSGYDFESLKQAADLLHEHGLLKENSLI